MTDLCMAGAPDGEGRGDTPALEVGERLVFDRQADASYLTVRLDIGGVARTVQVTASLFVDLDSDGRVLGVESVNGMLHVDELADVLARVRWEGA